ncbi:MAG: hypothetical protein Q9187_008264 [Circinaria calcarea]
MLPLPYYFAVYASMTFAMHSIAPRSPLSGGLTKREVPINTSDYPAYNISIPIDHYNTFDTRTYSNRNRINTTYYNSRGPVFYFDSGEQNAHLLVPYFLAEAAGPSSMMTLARRFNGMAVISEHRFYGDLTQGSFPFKMNTTTGMAEAGYDACRYLNTQQALQDVLFFANNFEPPGGSYPGIRKRPGASQESRNILCYRASSAPTQAAVDMWTYYAQAERSTMRNCSADYTAITNWVDATLTSGTEQEITTLKYDLYKAILSRSGRQIPQDINMTLVLALEPSEIASYLLTPFSFYRYYGIERSVLPFYNILETRNRTSVLTTDNGGTTPALAPESGLALTYKVSLAWTSFLTALTETNYDDIPYTDDPMQDASWMWQYCFEYGYFQRGNPANAPTIQSRFSLAGILSAAMRGYVSSRPAHESERGGSEQIQRLGHEIHRISCSHPGEYDP